MTQDLTESRVPNDAWDLLAPQLTESRRTRILHTAKHRTRQVRLVVQDVHQPHNVSACIRSAEAFGIEDIDVVTLHGKFNTSTVARGVDEWVNIYRHESVKSCVENLHQQGYLVAAAFPHGNAVSLDDLPLDKPIAVAFGNEHAGLDLQWREHSDMCFTIPMCGIVESLNISVCAAITLHHLTTNMRRRQNETSFYLSADEQQKLLNEWICRQITTWPLQVRRLRSERSLKPKD